MLEYIYKDGEVVGDRDICERLIVGNTNKEIKPFAFQNMSSLKSIEISDSVRRIGSCAFDGCKKLENVVLPDSVEEIDTSIFRRCEKLGTVKFSSNIKNIPFGTFSCCENLRSIMLPENVEAIDPLFIIECNNIEEIICSDKNLLPENLRHLAKDKNITKESRDMEFMDVFKSDDDIGGKYHRIDKQEFELTNEEVYFLNNVDKCVQEFPYEVQELLLKNRKNRYRALLTMWGYELHGFDVNSRVYEAACAEEILPLLGTDDSTYSRDACNLAFTMLNESMLADNAISSIILKANYHVHCKEVVVNSLMIGYSLLCSVRDLYSVEVLGNKLLYMMKAIDDVRIAYSTGNIGKDNICYSYLNCLCSKKDKLKLTENVELNQLLEKYNVLDEIKKEMRYIRDNALEIVEDITHSNKSRLIDFINHLGGLIN